jgi:hypothetical protein
MDEAAALGFLAEHLGVDADDFEYEWDDAAGHTFHQRSTDQRHTVHDPSNEDGPIVITSD